MKATPLEFRYRFWILLAIFALGFLAPWNYLLNAHGTAGGPNTHVWGRLAIALSRSGMEISVAFKFVLIAGIVLAFAGAALRTWGTACLGPEVLRDQTMHGERLIADGPYRFVRNPLYLGSWLNALALALLVSPSGALVMLTLLVFFQMRLVSAEEAYLTAQLGQPYADYCARVPRLLPALRPRVAGSGFHPSWGQAALLEIFLWGTAISFAAVGWRYDAHLLIQCVLVSFGAALIVRGIAMQPQTRAS